MNDVFPCSKTAIHVGSLMNDVFPCSNKTVASLQFAGADILCGSWGHWHCELE